MPRDGTATLRVSPTCSQRDGFSSTALSRATGPSVTTLNSTTSCSTHDSGIHHVHHEQRVGTTLTGTTGVGSMVPTSARGCSIGTWTATGMQHDEVQQHDEQLDVVWHHSAVTPASSADNASCTTLNSATGSSTAALSSTADAALRFGRRRSHNGATQHHTYQRHQHGSHLPQQSQSLLSLPPMQPQDG